MPRIRHVGGPVRYNHRALTGVSEPGDEHTVSDEAAEYLLNRRHFERVADEVVLTEGEDYEVHDDLSELTKEEVYARAQAADIAGRSQMNKDELIAALEE